jgi:hypothetical protein
MGRSFAAAKNQGSRRRQRVREIREMAAARELARVLD